MFIVTLFFFLVGSDIFGLMKGDDDRINQWMSIGLLSFPLTFSVYLALDFADTNRDLWLRLREIEALSEITRQQEAEKYALITNQARELELTVSERTKEVRKQADQLREMDAVKSRFVVNLTHELRTPLSLIMGPAGQLQQRLTEPNDRKNASLISTNAGKLLRLINQLLDLNKLEAGKMELQWEAADITAILSTTVESFEGLAIQNHVQLRCSSVQETLLVMTDAPKLEMILHNLLSNAVKFSKPQGLVTVNLTRDQQTFTITVKDHGSGIPEAQLPYVFDRFYQADTSDRRQHEGSGVGLSLTKELVELMNGQIVINSMVDWGTEVKITLPLKEIRALTASSILPITSELPVVLIIEDNTELREFMRDLLAGHYTVITAANGNDGLTIAIQQVPDLVITDLMMPLMDGYQVCSELKAQVLTSHIPVIMLTAKTSVGSKTQGWRTGADAYLTKPFNQQELLALLQNLIENRKRLLEQYRREDAWAKASERLPSKDQQFVTRVREVIEAHLDNDQLSVDLLADKVNLSKAQLHRKLKGSIGQAPGDLIRIVRLQHAHQLLKAGAGTVSEIAYRVGFNSPATFSTSFSNHYGYPPSGVKS